MVEKNEDLDAQLASHTTSIRNLEVQMGQISQALNTRPKGSLSSYTVVNPKGGNNTGHVMEIITRSGRVKKAKAPLPKPPSPYLQRLAKQNGENQFKKSIQMMKGLSINVQLVEASEQMPRYAKFMKDLVTKKRSMNFETIKVTHQVSEIVHSMDPKLEDSDALMIPCTIRSSDFAKALCDTRASINLMPYSVFKTLGIGKARPISMSLQMVDHIMKRPLGVIEDVLVQVDKFILAANFVILDCEFDYEVPIILGRHFLYMCNALCDVGVRELTFRVGDEQVVFHVCKSMRQPNSNEVCSFVDFVINVIIEDTSATINVGDMLESTLLKFADDRWIVSWNV
ncbi:uncharacterized protein [Nicotiana tomentosiformis]|uniref:uncharacterized protein n=1 Tax=Nicotiana tomentosiformis TaxID=4098 RepID=UPI00388C6942